MMGDKALLKEIVDLNSVPMVEVFETLRCDTNGLSTKAAEERLALFGQNIVEKQESKKFLGYLWNPFSGFMGAAAIMCITLANGGGKPPDWQTFFGIIVLLFYNLTTIFFSENTARRAADILLKVLRDGKWIEANASVLVPGDIISIKHGDVIPADARLLEGAPLKIDESALTGELFPVVKSSGDFVYSGTTCMQGEIEALVISTGVYTFFGNVAYPVDSWNGKFSFYHKALTAIGEFCICFIGTVVFVQMLVGCSIQERGYRNVVDNILVVLIGGIPIAMPLVLSCTMTNGFFRLSQQGAITKRMSTIEKMACMDVLCVEDKGFLTLNQLSADRNLIEVFAENVEPDDVVLMAARASRLEDQDAVDAAVVGMLADPKEARNEILEVDFLPFNPTDKRTALTYIDSEHKMHRVSKGDPEQILNLVHNKSEIESSVHFVIDKYAERGLSSLAVAYQEVPEGKKESPGDSWQFIGLIPLFDPPRHDSAENIRRALELGVDVKMFTGDQLAIGKETGRRLGMGTNIYPESALTGNYCNYEIIEKADGFSGVSSESKFQIVSHLKDRGHICGVTVDGVEDVLTLKNPDISIAFADATNAARIASDIVLTEHGLSVIISAVLTSRTILQRVKNYTIYAVSSTVLIVLCFSLLAIIWEFDFAPFMVLIIVIVNNVLVVAISKDRVKPSPQPDEWKLKEILIPGIVLGVYLAMMTVVFFWAAYETDFFPRVFKVTSLHKKDVKDFKMLTSAVFMQVSTISQALIFLTRSRGWSYTERSLELVLSSFVMTQMFSTLIAVYADMGFAFKQGIGWRWAGVIWLYDLIVYMSLDPLKLLIYYILREKKSKREELALKWAHAQRALHGLEPPKTGFTDEVFDPLIDDANKLNHTDIFCKTS